jgi:hypothetical protein
MIRLPVGHEPVADARLGGQDLRVVGVSLELLTQLAHVDPQVLDVFGIL